MREKRIALGIVFFTTVSVSAASFTFAQQPATIFPFQKHLQTVGLHLSSESPEEAALVVNLPKIYILPDSPLYFLKVLWEGAQLVLSTDPEKRGEILLALAEKRLSEGIALIKKGEWQGAVITLQRYQGQFENAQNMLGLISDIQKYDALRQQISRHLQNQALLTTFLEKIGAGGVMRAFKPKIPIGGLELRAVE